MHDMSEHMCVPARGPLQLCAHDNSMCVLLCCAQLHLGYASAVVLTCLTVYLPGSKACQLPGVACAAVLAVSTGFAPRNYTTADPTCRQVCHSAPCVWCSISDLF